MGCFLNNTIAPAKTLVLGTDVDAAQEILAFIFQPFLTNEIEKPLSCYILGS